MTLTSTHGRHVNKAGWPASPQMSSLCSFGFVVDIVFVETVERNKRKKEVLRVVLCTAESVLPKAVVTNEVKGKGTWTWGWPHSYVGEWNVFMAATHVNTPCFLLSNHVSQSLHTTTTMIIQAAVCDLIIFQPRVFAVQCFIIILFSLGLRGIWPPNGFNYLFKLVWAGLL